MEMGKPTGSGKTIPTFRRRACTFLISFTLRPSTRTLPSVLAPGMKSRGRLMALRSVVFPEFDGPMIPRISPRLAKRETSFRAVLCPYLTVKPWMSTAFSPALRVSGLLSGAFSDALSATRSPLLSGAKINSKGDRGEVEAKDEAEKHHGRPELDRLGHLPTLGGNAVEVVGKRHGLVEDTFRQRPPIKDCPAKEDRRRLASGPRDLENDSRQDPTDRVGKDHVPDRLPARGSNVPASLTEGHLHRCQGLLGAGDDHGQGHDGQRERCQEDARLANDEEQW